MLFKHLRLPLGLVLVVALSVYVSGVEIEPVDIEIVSTPSSSIEDVDIDVVTEVEILTQKAVEVIEIEPVTETVVVTEVSVKEHTESIVVTETVIQEHTENIVVTELEIQPVTEEIIVTEKIIQQVTESVIVDQATETVIVDPGTEVIVEEKVYESGLDEAALVTLGDTIKIKLINPLCDVLDAVRKAAAAADSSLDVTLDAYFNNIYKQTETTINAVQHAPCKVADVTRNVLSKVLDKGVVQVNEKSNECTIEYQPSEINATLEQDREFSYITFTEGLTDASEVITGVQNIIVILKNGLDEVSSSDGVVGKLTTLLEKSPEWISDISDVLFHLLRGPFLDFYLGTFKYIFTEYHLTNKLSLEVGDVTKGYYQCLVS